MAFRRRNHFQAEAKGQNSGAYFYSRGTYSRMVEKARLARED